jgi:hypothetical protein
MEAMLGSFDMGNVRRGWKVMKMLMEGERVARFLISVK